MADAHAGSGRSASRLARVCAGLLALLVLLTLSCEGGEEPARSPPATTATPTASATVAPVSTATATPSAAASPTATPTATATPSTTATPATPTQVAAATPVATATTTTVTAPGSAVASDRAALVALYEATDGANWRNSTTG